MDTYRSLAIRFNHWARVSFMHGNAIREPRGDAKGPSSNRKNEYFRRRVMRREYLIFSRDRETQTGTIGLFVLRIDHPPSVIDVFEEGSPIFLLPPSPSSATSDVSLNRDYMKLLPREKSVV